jgi:hypothetical protein
MKRHGHLWEKVISFGALLRAAEQACKAKRFRPDVAAFHFNAVFGWFGQMITRPGRSGRPQGSKAPPGCLSQKAVTPGPPRKW